MNYSANPKNYLLKTLSVAIAVVFLGVLAFPVIVASTLDPCEAVARVFVRKAPKSGLNEPLETIANEVAVKIGAAYARSHGILACYRMLPKALKNNNVSD